MGHTDSPLDSHRYCHHGSEYSCTAVHTPFTLAASIDKHYHRPSVVPHPPRPHKRMPSIVPRDTAHISLHAHATHEHDPGINRAADRMARLRHHTRKQHGHQTPHLKSRRLDIGPPRLPAISPLDSPPANKELPHARSTLQLLPSCHNGCGNRPHAQLSHVAERPAYVR